MLDWKIVGASFAALIVISTVMLGNFGIGDFFSDLFGKTGDLLGGSPFGGFFSNPTARNMEVDVTLFPDNFVLIPDSKINLTIDSINLEEFQGEIRVYFSTQTLVLKEANSPLIVNTPLQEIKIENIVLNKLLLENEAFEIKPNISTSNGTMDMTGFLGTAFIHEDNIELIGNVSSLRIEIAGLEFQLV